jgi:hypothetical protein
MKKILISVVAAFAFTLTSAAYAQTTPSTDKAPPPPSDTAGSDSTGTPPPGTEAGKTDSAKKKAGKTKQGSDTSSDKTGSNTKY